LDKFLWVCVVGETAPGWGMVGKDMGPCRGRWDVSPADIEKGIQAVQATMNQK